jgi:putative holliday junction resolvase
LKDLKAFERMLTDTNKRVLAIDYGSKRIGIALSDPFRLFPSITITLANDNNIFTELLKIISEKNVDKIILGFPDNEGKPSTHIAKDILKFKNALELKSKLQIELWDEHLTSQMAMSRIISSVTKKSKRQNKSLVDAQAALIILEEYLKSVEDK